jgi:hypothetical protein
MAAGESGAGEQNWVINGAVEFIKPEQQTNGYKTRRAPEKTCTCTYNKQSYTKTWWERRMKYEEKCEEKTRQNTWKRKSGSMMARIFFPSVQQVLCDLYIYIKNI